MDYAHKVQPWHHQSVVFELSRDRDEFALLMEQRTGKSKVLIDTCAWNYSNGRITGLLVVAPNGVDADWAQKYFAQHWPDWAGTPVIAHWEGGLRKKDEAALYDPSRATLFHVLCMNVEAFSRSPRAQAAAEKFLRIFKVLMAVDESSLIKDPSSGRTKNVTKLGKRAVMRRILTGTPSTQSPLDIFAQFKFLNIHLLGFQSYYAFKAHFAEILPESSALVQNILQKLPANKRRNVPQIVATDSNGRPKYKNLDELQKLMDPHCFRIKREQCGDTPEKLYSTRSVPLTDEQKHHYDLVVENILVETSHGELTVSNQLTRLLRLQQITGGFMPHDHDDGHAQPLKQNRIEALLQEVEQVPGGVIVWARFRAELNAIAEALREAYGHAAVVEYHGGIADELREQAKTAFKLETHDQFPKVRFFVGNQAAGSYGLELTVADHVVYYSNLFSLEKRLQSEDRPITLMKPQGVAYLDLQALGTVDDKIVAALQGKKEVADSLLDSGGLTAWLKREKK